MPRAQNPSTKTVTERPLPDGADQHSGNGAIPPPAAAVDMSVFDNLDDLRIADPAAFSGDVEHLTYLAVRKPRRDEYFRACPNPDLAMTTAIWTDEETRDVYIILPGAREVMAESCRVVALVLCQNRQCTSFFWPVSADTRARGWAESARAAVVIAQRKWIKIRGDLAGGAYVVYEAANQNGEPNWPDLTLSGLLKLAFRDRLIDTPMHAAVRRLQGY
jgi:hypothetical protein